jgi:hypothetical protein
MINYKYLEYLEATALCFLFEMNKNALKNKNHDSFFCLKLSWKNM